MATVEPQPRLSRPPVNPPLPFRNALGRLGRKLRIVNVLQGLGILALVATLGALPGLVADFFWTLPESIRWGFWGIWLAALVFVGLTMVVWPLVRRQTWADLAAVAERTCPGLGECLTGAVDLLGREGSSRGSPIFIEALGNEAAERLVSEDPARGISSRREWTWFGLGLLALSLAIAPTLAWPDPFAKLWARYLAPWADLPRVGPFLVSVEPGDAVLATGDDLTILAEIRPRFSGWKWGLSVPESAWVEWRNGVDVDRDSKSPRSVRMVALAEAEKVEGQERPQVRSFAITLPRLASSIDYRVIGGRADGAIHHVRVIEPPGVAKLSATVEPPAYTGLPTLEANDPSRMLAWQDSLVTLTIEPNGPIRKAELLWPEEVEAGETPASRTISLSRSTDGLTWTATVSAQASGPFSILLEDEHGLSSRPEAPRRLEVRIDAPPNLALTGSGEPRPTAPGEVLRIGLAASDDFGLAGAELHYKVHRSNSAAEAEVEVGAEENRLPVELEGFGSRSARGVVSLDLRPLALKDGDRVSYRLRVLDNRPLPRGPNETWSGDRALPILANADLQADRAAAELESIQERLDAIKALAEENREAGEALRSSAEEVVQGNGRWEDSQARELDRRERSTREVGERLRLLAKDLAEDPRFTSFTRLAQQVAEVEVEASRELLDQAKRAQDDNHRLSNLKQAETALKSTRQRLQELQGKLDELAQLEADRQRLTELADREADLADRAEALARSSQNDVGEDSPVDRARLDQLQAAQADLRQELEELLQRSPSLRVGELAKQVQQAEALADLARDLADRQRAESRQTGELVRVDPEVLRELAEAQRTLETDTRKLALRIDPSMEQSGQGRTNTEVVRRVIEALEIGDFEEAGRRMEDSGRELRRLASTLTDTFEDPKANARRLTALQQELQNEVTRAVRETVRDRNRPTEEDREALARRFDPLLERQESLLRTLKTLDVPREQEGDHRQAIDQQQQATKTLQEGKTRESEEAQNQARDRLNRLANTLPDVNKRRTEARKPWEEARRRTDQVARELEKHLRETSPQPGKPYDADQAQAELARRLASANLSRIQREAAEHLERLPFDPQTVAQRERAAQRARTLAEALDKTNRAALPAALLDARAALERLGNKIEGRLTADEIVEELASEIAKAKANPATPSNDIERWAAALRGLQVPDALDWRNEAVRRVEQVARIDIKENENKNKSIDEEAVLKAVEAVEALAGRLNDRLSPSERAAALARLERAMDEPDSSQVPAAIAEAQRRIAADLALLPVDLMDQENGNKNENEGGQVLEEARERVAVAVELSDLAARLDLGNPPIPFPIPGPEVLAGVRSRAADALDRLAETLPADVPERSIDGNIDPNVNKIENDQDLAIEPLDIGSAQDLARRQRRLQEQLQAVLAARIPPQMALRDESAALGRSLAELRERSRESSPRGQRPAQAAADLLANQAPRTMAEAAEQLAQPRPSLARETQHRAAELLERAAQQAAELASGLRADFANAGGDPERDDPPGPVDAEDLANADADFPDNDHPAEAPPPTPADLGSARQAMEDATRQLEQARDPDLGGSQAVQEASDSLRQAAEGLRAAAQPPEPADPSAQLPIPSLADQNQDPGGSPTTSPGESAGNGDEPKDGLAGTVAPDLSDLQAALRAQTGRSWGELPGHLRSEILQMSQGRYRDDYARLIRLYFREIAGAGESP